MKFALKAILTVLFGLTLSAACAAQTSPKMPVIDRKYWHVEAYLFHAPGYNRYRIEIRKHPAELYNWSIDTSKVTISVFDRNGMPVSGFPHVALATGTPIILKPTQDKDGFDIASLMLVVDPGELTEGSYKITVSGPVDAVDAESHESISLSPIKVEGKVDLAWMPKTLPKLAPGQQFLCMPPEKMNEPAPYKDKAAGTEVPWKDIVLKIFELKDIQPLQDGKSRLTFLVEDRSKALVLEADAVIDRLPLIYPIVEDTDIDLAQKKLQNHAVWVFGGVDCSLFISKPISIAWIKGHPTDAVTIKHIVRLFTPQLPVNATGNVPIFRSDNPIVVLFKMPVKIGFSMASWYTDAKESLNANLEKMWANIQHTATGFYSEYCDKQELDRSFSLVHPFKLHPEWPHKVRQAVSDGDIIKGMSYDAAAWAWGWPGLRRTTSEIKKLGSWEYGQNTIEFKNGKVIDYGSDIRLP